MTELQLKFHISLEGSYLRRFTGPHGFLFHRWLPNGKKDSILLDTGAPNAQLEIWFERRGVVKNNSIEYVHNRKEIDPKIMSRQGALDSGPLMGKLSIQGLSREELVPLKEEKKGDEKYIQLGKRIVKKLIYPSLSRFIDIIRINYGQYWISAFERWDSRNRSLGDYCQNCLNLKWSLDQGENWNYFLPNEPMIHIKGRRSSVDHFKQYITEEDWDNIQGIVKSDYEPTLVASLLSKTYRLSEEGNMKFAFVEGVTALELAIEEFMRENLANAGGLQEEVKAFWSLPLVTRVITIAVNIDEISLQDLIDTVEAVSIRNDLVHEGKNPPEGAMKRLTGLLHTAKALVSAPTLRFQMANPGNLIQEEW